MKRFLLVMIIQITISAVAFAADKEPYIVISSDEETVTFYYDDLKEQKDGEIYGISHLLYDSWKDKIVRIVFDSSFSDYRPTSTGSWFQEFKNLTMIEGITNLNTSEVKYMDHMFDNCNSLTSIDVSHFDTSNVTNMKYMFCDCSRLTSIDVSHFDTSNVTSMECMFWGCSMLTTIDVSHFDTSNVNNLYGMFMDCSSLTSLDLGNFNTSKVYDLGDLLHGCESLTSIDLSNFDTSSAISMIGIFYCCSNLTSLDLSNFDTSKVMYVSANHHWYGMFDGCSRLKHLNLSSFNTSKVTKMDYMFRGCSSLDTLDLSSFNTSNVSLMKEMFYDCSNLKSLNLSSFDTSMVTDMSSIFSGCSSLTNLDLSNFDTSKVTSIYDMFENCKSLTSLDLSNFDTSKVMYISSLFSGCSSLTSIDLSSFDTSKVTSIRGVFYGCSNLTSIDLSNFDTSKVMEMDDLFYGCSSLTSLDLSNFETMHVRSMNRMFYGCSSLTSLDLSNINVYNTQTSHMMKDCSGLRQLKINPLFETIEYNACEGIGSISSPCEIKTIGSCDYGVDTSGDYFVWKSGYFRLAGTPDTTELVIGDVNGDTKINGSDIVELVDHIMGRTSNKFVEAAADLSGDGKINGSDLTLEIELVMSQGMQSAPMQSGITSDNLSISYNHDGSLYVSVDGGTDFILAQMIMELSPGQKLEGISTDKSHRVVCRQLSENRYFVLCYSSSNTPFSSNDDIITIHFSGEGAASITHAMLVDETRMEHYFSPACSGEAMGIATTAKDKPQAANVYSLNGELIRSQATSLEGLPKGIYLFNNKKMIVK